MADKKNPTTVPGGNRKSSGPGGGKGRSGDRKLDVRGNARVASEDPSPDTRRRGETSRADDARG